MTVVHSAPKFASSLGVLDALTTALGPMLLAGKEEHGEVILTVERDRLEDALRLLRDDHEYQQLMEIAGVDYPERAERFECNYCLLSLTKNHRVIVKVHAAESTPVPTVTTLWPVAGWLEREVFDMFGVIFAGNTDLRRILTDYGFEGHPFRKDFPLTGYQELRYSEEEQRVVYEPVELAQDLRQFDFMSPWEGGKYILPGDEKADLGSAAGLASGEPKVAQTPPKVVQPQSPPATPKSTETPAQTGAGEPANTVAVKRVAKAQAASRPSALADPKTPRTPRVKPKGGPA
jgi:NADH-quinone oxidoreductase subunit C